MQNIYRARSGTRLGAAPARLETRARPRRDTLHTAPDIACFIPVVNIPAEIAGVALALRRSDYLAAALSGAALKPIEGSLVAAARPALAAQSPTVRSVLAGLVCSVRRQIEAAAAA